MASLSAERENMKKRKLEARSSQSSASHEYVEVDLLGGAAASPSIARPNFQGMIDEANANLDTDAIKKFVQQSHESQKVSSRASKEI